MGRKPVAVIPVAFYPPMSSDILPHVRKKSINFSILAAKRREC
jgi:hypothetical protein